MDDGRYRIELQQQADYRFTVRFDQEGVPPLQTDEPPPLGTGAGPNPARLLGVSVANCLAASLLFALRKYGNEPGPLRAVATVHLQRNERGRLRIPRIEVVLHLGVPWEGLKHAGRALAQYEEFCVVTQSVRGGIEVQASVVDAAGASLPAAAAAAIPS